MTILKGPFTKYISQDRGGGSRKKSHRGEGMHPKKKKMISLSQNFLYPIFLQLRFFSVSHGAVILQWATIAAHLQEAIGASDI